MTKLQKQLLSKFWEMMAVVFIGTPLMAYMTPTVTVHYLQEAARRGDADALAGYIDFPSVYQNFKAQLEAVIDDQHPFRSQENASATNSTDPRTTVADPMIDFLATPAGIQQLMMGAKPYVDNGKIALAGKAVSGQQNELLSTASSEYESIDRYVVTMTTDDGKSLRFILHRLPRTAIWRVAEIRLPLPDAG